MEKYELTAVTLKGDIAMGFIYPAIFMFPILAVRLALFYSGIDSHSKAYSIILISLTFTVLYMSYLLMKEIRERLINKYVVELDKKNIRIWESGKEIMSGPVSSCKIKTKGNARTSAVIVDIHTNTDKISLRARPKEYTTITGRTSFNPFGTGSSSDMNILLALGRKITEINS